MFGARTFQSIVNSVIARMLRRELEIIKRGKRYRPKDIEYYPVWTRNGMTKKKCMSKLMIKLNEDTNFYKITQDIFSDHGIDPVEVIEYLEQHGAKRVTVKNVSYK